jgi:hypothetical protein
MSATASSPRGRSFSSWRASPARRRDGDRVRPDCLLHLEGHRLLAVDADAGAHLRSRRSPRRRRAGAPPSRRAPSPPPVSRTPRRRRARRRCARDLARALVEAAGRHGEVRGRSAAGWTPRGEAERVDARAIEIDRISRSAPPSTCTAATPSTCSSAGLEHVLGVLAHLAEGALAAERVREDRRCRDVEAADRSDPRASRRELEAGSAPRARAPRWRPPGWASDVELEEHDHRRHALARERAHAVDAVDRDDGVFDGAS